VPYTVSAGGGWTATISSLSKVVGAVRRSVWWQMVDMKVLTPCEYREDWNGVQSQIPHHQGSSKNDHEGKNDNRRQTQ